MLSSTIALVLLCGTLAVQSESNAEHNVYTNAVRSPGSKAKKIQIVYIKVPLSKVLENPSDGYNSGDRGYAEGGGGQQQNYDNGGGIPGEGRVPNYNGNSIANNYQSNFGDNSYAANQNSFDAVKPNGQEVFANNDGYNQQQQQQQQEESNIGPYGPNGQPKQTINYPNDGNLGSAYGAAVGNALPPTHFDDSPNYGQESQNTGYGQTNQINYDQNNGFHNNQAFNRPVNDGYEHSDGYGGDNYDNRKMRKGNQPFSKMMANFRPQIPIMSTLPSFSMKGFNSPTFGAGFPSFSPSFGGMAAMPVTSLSGIGGFSGSMKGLGGIKSKLSMLLGNKFGMGGAGGLLGGMMGWD